MEMFRVFGYIDPGSDKHLRVEVELNADVFAGQTDEWTKNMLKICGRAILNQVDDTVIDKSEVED